MNKDQEMIEFERMSVVEVGWSGEDSSFEISDVVEVGWSGKMSEICVGSISEEEASDAVIENEE
jgi:hypothetical protein